MNRRSEWVSTHVSRLLDETGLSGQWTGPGFTGAVHRDCALAAGIMAATLVRAGGDAPDTLMRDTRLIWGKWNSSRCAVDTTLEEAPALLQKAAGGSERWLQNLAEFASDYFQSLSSGHGFADQVGTIASSLDGEFQQSWQGYGLLHSADGVWENVLSALVGPGGLYAEGGLYGNPEVTGTQVASLSSALQAVGLAINYGLYRNEVISEDEYQKFGGSPSIDLSGAPGAKVLKVLTESELRGRVPFSAAGIPEFASEILPVLVWSPGAARDAILQVASEVERATYRLVA